jgi:hypothetical protein
MDKVLDNPVILVVAETTVKQAWWIPIQKHLANVSHWRQRGSIVVNIPSENSLDDIDGLLMAISETRLWLRSRTPQSINDAISFHEKKVTQTDPRFKSKISIDHRGATHHLSTSEPVKLKFAIKGKKGVIESKVNSLLQKGEPVPFLPGELSISGTKLFESVSESGATLQCKREFRASIDLSLSPTHRSLNEIHGVLVGGLSEFKFDGSLSGSPFSLKISSITPAELKQPFQIQFEIDPKKWNGQKLLHLAYFEQLSDFFSSWSEQQSVKIAFNIQGNRVLSGQCTAECPEFIKEFSAFASGLSKLRKVTRVLNLNPTFEIQNVAHDFIQDVEQLYGLLFQNGWEGPRPNVSMTATCKTKTLNREVLRTATAPGTVQVKTALIYRLFETEYRVDDVEQTFTHARLVEIPDIHKSTRKPKGKGQSTVLIKMIGNEETTWHIALPNAMSQDLSTIPK